VAPDLAEVAFRARHFSDVRAVLAAIGDDPTSGPVVRALKERWA
jgi:hypothetical protein